jgi:hypothetical protein
MCTLTLAITMYHSEAAPLHIVLRTVLWSRPPPPPPVRVYGTSRGRTGQDGIGIWYELALPACLPAGRRTNRSYGLLSTPPPPPPPTASVEIRFCNHLFQ